MKEIDKIRKLCKEKGLKLKAVLREAKVPDDTERNWNRKNPVQFETRDKIHEAIKTLSSPCTINE